LKSPHCSEWNSPDDLEPVGAHPIEGGEALVAERVAGELLQAARAAVVEQLGVVLEQDGPRLAVARLEGLDGGFHRRILERVGEHPAPLPHRRREDAEHLSGACTLTPTPPAERPVARQYCGPHLGRSGVAPVFRPMIC
jgi:hypothetical protein